MSFVSPFGRSKNVKRKRKSRNLSGFAFPSFSSEDKREEKRIAKTPLSPLKENVLHVDSNPKNKQNPKSPSSILPNNSKTERDLLVLLQFIRTVDEKNLPFKETLRKTPPILKMLEEFEERTHPSLEKRTSKTLLVCSRCNLKYDPRENHLKMNISNEDSSNPDSKLTARNMPHNALHGPCPFHSGKLKNGMWDCCFHGPKAKGCVPGTHITIPKQQ